MARPEDKGKQALPPVGSTPPSAEAIPLKRLSRLIVHSWELISAVVGITALVVAGVVHFATNTQVNALDCRLNRSLDAATLSEQEERLRVEIELAETELIRLKSEKGSNLEAGKKERDIADLRVSKREKHKDWEAAYKTLGSEVCSPKPDNTLLGMKP